MRNQMPFARNVKALRLDRGMSQSDLADALGVTRPTVSNWEGSYVARPRQQEIVNALKELFGVSDEELFDGSGGYYAKSRGLSSAVPPGAIPVSDGDTAYAPLLGKVHAGNACDPEMLDYRAPLPVGVWEAHPGGYFLRVEGGCMDRVYPEGCHIYIDPACEPRDGDIAVVKVDGEYVVRRLHRGNDAMILSPESHDPSWRDMVVQGDSTVELVGTVVWFQSGELLG